MIFLSGIHGVGKTFFCDMAKEKLGIKSYAASQLIAEEGRRGFSMDKFESGIDKNQLLLIKAVEELRGNEKEFIFEGWT